MLSAGIADLGAELDLFEDGDDLRLTESGFLHAETSAGVDSLLLNGAKIRGGFNLAKRFTRQLRLPAQFVLPTLTLPALNEVIRDVGRGTADLKELLATGCRAAGVNVRGALDAL